MILVKLKTVKENLIIKEFLDQVYTMDEVIFGTFHSI